MNFSIDPGLSPLGASMLVVRGRTDSVKSSSAAMQSRLQAAADDIAQNLTAERLAELAPIASFRAAMTKLGRNPNRYRISSEALFRWIVQGKGIYFINNLVDLNNYMCLASYLPVGSSDLSAIVGDVVMRKGRTGEIVETIAKGDFDFENCVVLADDIGPFGSPINDSKRCMVRDTTKSFISVFYSFSGIPSDEILREFAAIAGIAEVAIEDAQLLSVEAQTE
jgi:DNA/RNA-binding domain of Phe-tRNA-synthetase-like protein